MSFYFLVALPLNNLPLDESSLVKHSDTYL